MQKIKYHKVNNGKYIYELDEALETPTEVHPECTATILYKGRHIIVLTAAGTLYIEPPYQWDGPSGPVRHTPEFMRGSLIHDALYQLIRSGKIPKKHRYDADLELYHACVQDGMSDGMAAVVYYAVRLFGWLFI